MKYKLIFTLLLTLVTIFFLYKILTPKKPNIPSAKKDEIITLINFCNQKLKESEPKICYINSKKLISESSKYNYSYGIAYGNFFMGWIMTSFGEFNIALNYFSLAEKEEYAKNDPILMSEILIMEARTYRYLNLPDLALVREKESFKLINKIQSIKDANILKTKLYINIALSSINNSDSLQHYTVKAHNTYKLLKNKDTYTNMLISLNSLTARSFLIKNQYDSANYYLQKSITIAKKRNYRNVSILYFMKGKVKQQMKQSDSALYYYTKSQKNMEEIGFTGNLPTILLQISDIYKEMGDYAKSNEYKAKLVEFKSRQKEGFTSATTIALTILVKNKEQKQKEEEQKMKKKIIFIFFIFTSITVIILLLYFSKKQHLSKEKILVQEQIILEKNKKTRLLEQQINKALDEVIQLAKNNSPHFFIRFSEIYPEFIPSLLYINPKLQNSELAFCAYLYLNFSSKDIATYTFVTPRAVQLRKNRLRKKLNISSEADIYIWIQNISQ